jgi:hypothetical protein
LIFPFFAFLDAEVTPGLDDASIPQSRPPKAPSAATAWGRPWTQDLSPAAFGPPFFFAGGLQADLRFFMAFGPPPSFSPAAFGPPVFFGQSGFWPPRSCGQAAAPRTSPCRRYPPEKLSQVRVELKTAFALFASLTVR